jgi:hypothetical protein
MAPRLVVVVPLRAGFCVFCGSLRHSALLQDLLFAQRRGTQEPQRDAENYAEKCLKTRRTIGMDKGAARVPEDSWGGADAEK